MTAVFHVRPYGRFIETKSKLKRKNFFKQIKAPTFLEAVLEIETSYTNNIV